MMNTDDFRARLSKIMSYYGLSASAFAELIQVQKSSISHVLSGRNKPSLDFLAKVESTFEEVSFSWLLKGEQITAAAFPSAPTPIQAINSEKTKPEPTVKIDQPAKSGSPVTIVHYYADGSFETFHKR